ncbi:MAG: TPM domain-containing protein [Actinobacteria bacterium]|nr:TPM domain-containing protein [Actinomycetota bacterium]
MSKFFYINKLPIKQLLILLVVTVALSLIGFNFSSSLAIAEPVYPELTDYVNDYASMFDETNKQNMRTVLEELEKDTSAQIFIATVENLQGVTVEEYAVKLFEKWGIGQAEKDNGVLILIAKQERSIRIEVGYGLEPVVTDAIAGRTINDIMIPNFKNGEFDAGTYEAVTYLAGLIAKDAGVSLKSLDQSGGSQEASTSSFLDKLNNNFDIKYFAFIFILFVSINTIVTASFAFIFVLFALIIIIVIIIKKRCPNCKKLRLKTIYKILKEATYIEQGLQLVIRDCSNCGFHDESEVIIPKKSRTSTGSSFDGSSSSSGLSGGGGSSGGGGASGKW